MKHSSTLERNEDDIQDTQRNPDKTVDDVFLQGQFVMAQSLIIGTCRQWPTFHLEFLSLRTILGIGFMHVMPPRTIRPVP